MYLKRLELKGFKSFPTKTDVLFNEGITAIVGPNGSGKSNISDAVRWVLGEQSIKSLRGDKLEDVVFAGTDTKKAMNYCEVALTIDNSDKKLDIEYSEITIKRRAYRSGESEFFLNNKSCRLKDIKELLLDTGIGKDGYSIIEQGKVDEILSNNPVNRRKVFDEACGISKYRYKKQEAERNLKNTKENLNRIEDIYVEIENQLKPLETQQKKAIKYLEIKEELKKIEVNSYISEIEELEFQAEETLNHDKVLKDQMISVKSKKETLEKSITDCDEELEEIDVKINKTIEYINTIKGVINKKYSELSVLNEKIKNCNSDIQRYTNEISYINKKINDDSLELKKLNENKDNAFKNLKDIENKIDEVEIKNKDKKESINKVSQTIETLKDEIINLLDIKQNSANKLSTLNANIENIENRTKTIDIDIEHIQKKICNKKEEISKFNSQKQEKLSLIENLKQEFEDINKKVNSLKIEYDKISIDIQGSKLKINEYNSKLNIYTDMEKHYEGFNKGVKEVLKNKNLEGIYGALGQVISSSQKYEKALEASLGSYMQNIITKDENSAKNAINYLKKNNLGRVTFLPLNIIKSNKIDKNAIKSSTKYIGIASELVKFDEKYKNIIENVLGRTIVIGTMDEAIKFARETNHRYKVVTLDGEILNPGGSLTGGTVRTNGNILSRKRLIEEFKENIEKEKQKLNSLEQEKTSLRCSIDSNLAKIEKINNELRESDKNVVVINANIKSANDEVSNLNNNLNKFENEKLSLGENLEYTLTKTKSLKENINEIEQKHLLNKNEIEALNSKLKEINDGYEVDKSRFDDLNIEYAKLNQIHQATIKDIDRIQKEIKSQNDVLRTTKEQLEESKSNTVKIQDQIKIETSEKENLENQIIDENKKLSLQKEQKDSIKKNRDSITTESKNIDRQYIEVKESLFKIENKIERLRSSKENYIAKLIEEYELSLEEAKALKDESVVIDKKELENLKRQIKSLGNVNIDSIKEYEEIKERYDFYSEQKKDLEESIEVIYKLIKELEENMKREFNENFILINENFKVVYKKLFGGGNGELRIVDKDNILESDIEIVAQPPGKKMKNLNLLSGGEKALTAISILFSIILAKPTPFCILDEIEAPLDDANIYRFGEFLKELSKDTQFISITHRRGTMEVADYIYGVTMQEKAISKVISLDLKEAKKLTEDII
ncbi:chromosome segregation protein SMC [Paraclostridium bifermentans]|uniref:chromosome segregation protein SMC n=1 Tax=Paraclostridium bifermentans TaxID=1490 RepID=UPI001C1024EA|nr:chromosome segregation protein SMC [Paraclostridium bifermentans]MBS5952909.1 chromosome segregation protein SMC [Paraclostridium bifermentans]MBU5289004.1 chromosome segregation protein SMC [Paraclostridium bifermentans]